MKTLKKRCTFASQKINARYLNGTDYQINKLFMAIIFHS